MATNKAQGGACLSSLDFLRGFLWTGQERSGAEDGALASVVQSRKETGKAVDNCTALWSLESIDAQDS